MTEFFDWVDRMDRVIGVTSREDAHRYELFHRAVHIYAKGKDQGLWLQRRSMNKDLEPGLWTVSCSGHVDRGESYLVASVREFSEELGVALSPEEVDEIHYISPSVETGYEFIRSYQVHRPISPSPSALEVMEVREVPLADLNCWLAESPQEFAQSFRYLFPKLREKLTLLHKR
jgi:isopentenyldiphosphate isomerase